MEKLTAFAAWLGATPLAAAVTAQAWIVPALQVVHILAIAAVVIAAVVVNLHGVNLLERDCSVQALHSTWLPVLIGAVALLALTGVLLIASEPGRALFRTAFWVKLGLVVVVVAATAAHRLIAGRSSVVRAVLAVVALVALAGAIFAGRWIAYADGWPGAPA